MTCLWMRPRLAAVIGAFAVATSAPAAQGVSLVDASSLTATEVSDKIERKLLRRASRQVDVVVRLSDPPVAAVAGRSSRLSGATLTDAQQSTHAQMLTDKQTVLASQISALGGTELARVRITLNAVIVRIDAFRVRQVAALPGVISVRPVVNYELDLSQAIPYIGAHAVQLSGITGAGVVVAVLDSGIDYTHRRLGGPGTAAAYTAAYGTSTADARNKTLDGLFPTAKVIGGYDFVGEVWPNGPLAPDPDPIDCGPEAGIACDGGHGTHVADIIAGVVPSDGIQKGGVAPGAKLMAVKVCSAVSPACSGVAILQAFDFALDPNGDGSMSDAVDVVNLSLGSSYGQKEDDSLAAAENAVAAGVVVVASAGNSADRPYIAGSPSVAPGAISVAQTTHPADVVYLINAVGLGPPALAVWQPWSQPPKTVSGPLRYDTTNAGTQLGCTNAAGASPWVGQPLAGTIALIDRGTCAVSLKVANAGAAGAIAAVVANNVPQGPGELPPIFSYGGGVITIAGYTVTRADGLRLKAVNGNQASIDASKPVSIVGSMVSSSSRGPSYSYQSIKPDIGAPGALLSAEAGTGTGQTVFGGTSGAAPMIAGSAALLLQKYPSRTPSEIKSLLMNTAETDIYINSIGKDPTLLAPITRIGGGEVRVDRAIAARATAYDAADLTGSLSFGYHALDRTITLTKQVRVQNYANFSRSFRVVPTFRYEDDRLSDAVRVDTQSLVTVAPNGSRTFVVRVQIIPSRLPEWTLNGGSRGGDGFRLQGVEFDGYIEISDDTDRIRLPWHVLPHRAAAVKAASTQVTLTNGNGTLRLNNTSPVLDGRVDVFSLIGTSPRIPDSELPGVGDNFAIIDLASVGTRLVNLGGGALGIQFAVNTYGQRSHPNYPAEFDFYIDTNNDGRDDYLIFNLENGGFAATGQNVVAVFNLATGALVIRFFTDADLNSANAILTASLADLGITNLSQPIRITVEAWENYFVGQVTDQIANIVYAPGLPKFVPSNFAPVVPKSGSTTIGVMALPSGAVSTSQTGLLLLYRDAKKDAEAEAIVVN